MATMEVIFSCIASPQLSQTSVKLSLANFDFFSSYPPPPFFLFLQTLGNDGRYRYRQSSSLVCVRWRSKCTSAGSSGEFARLDGWHHRHGNSRAIGTARMANSTPVCPLVYASAYPHEGPSEARSQAKRCKWSLWSELHLKKKTQHQEVLKELKAPETFRTRSVSAAKPCPVLNKWTYRVRGF